MCQKDTFLNVPATFFSNHSAIWGFRNLRRPHSGKTIHGRMCFRNLYRQHSGKIIHDHMGLEKPVPVACSVTRDRKIHNRPYMLIFVRPGARCGAKIWWGVDRGQKQGKHRPRVPMRVDRYLCIMGLLKPIDTYKDMRFGYARPGENRGPPPKSC